MTEELKALWLKFMNATMNKDNEETKQTFKQIVQLRSAAIVTESVSNFSQLFEHFLISRIKPNIVPIILTVQMELDEDAIQVNLEHNNNVIHVFYQVFGNEIEYDHYYYENIDNDEEPEKRGANIAIFTSLIDAYKSDNPSIFLTYADQIKVMLT